MSAWRILGKGFKEVIKKTEHKNGFYVYLNLKEIDLNNIFFDSSDSDNSSLKSIKMKSKKFNFLNNTYLNQYFDVMFEDETIIKMIGESLNGTINIDQTNFVKIKLNNTKFKIKIKKNIPQQAGLGGGSMNAANILTFLIKRKFLKLSKKKILEITNLIGSDVILGITPNNTVLSSNNIIKKF